VASGGSNDNLKLEINYSLRSHVLPICKNSIVAPIGETSFKLRTLSPIEIYAGKTVALLNRGAARDLYDVFGMISKELFHGDDLVLLRKCVGFYSAISGRNPITLNSKIQFPDITPHMIKTDLNQMLRISEYFIGEAAIKCVSDWLNDLLILNEDELRFGKEFSEGRYQPELLFDDPETLERIKDHPMAIWRVNRNVQSGAAHQSAH